MNGEHVKFDSVPVFDREYSFIMHEIDMSQCGGCVHVVMKIGSLDGVKL